MGRTAEYWNEYVKQLRHNSKLLLDEGKVPSCLPHACAGVAKIIKQHLLVLLQEHPTMTWRLPDSLAEESGISLHVVLEALNQLVNEGKIFSHLLELNDKTYFATKERANITWTDAGRTSGVKAIDFRSFSDKQPEPPSMFDELEKILNDACLKVKEAVKINEQLFSLECDDGWPLDRSIWKRD